MAKNKIQEAQNPLILRCHRLMEAFAKSDEERQFYLDKYEGFLLYIDLDKSDDELNAFEKERLEHPERYSLIPRMTYYETKKLMENFVTEKVYDIDTKEKLLDIIQSKEARENFLEFIHDHHTEYEKWQQFYQERSRIQIIEWLRSNHFHFVFEEDLEMPKALIEKVKQCLFEVKVPKELQTARNLLSAKAKSYYSNEALNPRPKRGRPPKQAVKMEIEQQASRDIYTTVPPIALPFLFTPEITGAAAVSFSSKFDTQAEPLSFLQSYDPEKELSLDEKLLALRALSTPWVAEEKGSENVDLFADDDEDEDDEEEEEKSLTKKKSASNGKVASSSKKAAKVNGSAEKIAPKLSFSKEAKAKEKVAAKQTKVASAKKSSPKAAATSNKTATAKAKAAPLKPAAKSASAAAAPKKKTK